MNASKLFGMCIVFLAALVAVNAATNYTALDSLLQSYDSTYDDGSFTVQYANYSYVRSAANLPGLEAGRHYLNFTIGGSGTNQPYTIITRTNTINHDYAANPYLGGNVIVKIDRTSHASPQNVTITLDGNYYRCDPNGARNDANNMEFETEVRIYQNGILSKSQTFPIKVMCSSWPIGFGRGNLTAINNIGDAKFDIVNLTMEMRFPETKSYTIGASIWDNKTQTAYAETTVTPTASGQTINVSIIFASDLLRNFNLTNDKIQLKSITVNNNYLDKSGWIDYFNSNLVLKRFNTANFSFSEINNVSYGFDVSHTSGGKLTELGVVLNAQQATGTYDVKLTLSNQFNEKIQTKQVSVSLPATVWFNGTDIYNSRVNGPYRVGSISISKSGQEYIYEVAKGLSPELTYLNFTSSALPDLKVNSSDITKNGNDIDVTIHNDGTGDASGIVVSLYDSDANKAGELIIDRLAKGTSAAKTFSNAALSNAFVIIDFSNQIEESNESNNIAVLQTEITPPSISNPQPSGSVTINAGETTEFNITASGTGPFVYTWELNNNPIGTNSPTFAYTPDYYAEGSNIIEVNVSNANGSQVMIWNFNVTPTGMGIFAYAYNQTAIAMYGTMQAINSTVDFNGVLRNATDKEQPARTIVALDTAIPVTYSANGFQPLTETWYFDKGLFSCIETQGCSMNSATYDTSCVWDSTHNDNWICEITDAGNTMAFRLFANPKRVKISGFLTEN